MCIRDSHISPQLPKILESNRITVTKNASSELAPTQASDAYKNTSTYILYEDAKKTAGIVGDKVSSEMKKRTAKETIEKFTSDEKQEPKKKKELTKKSKSTEKRKANKTHSKQTPASKKDNTKNAPKLIDKRQSKTRSNKNTRRKPISYLLETTNMVKSFPKMAFNRMYNLTDHLSKLGKISKPNKRVLTSFNNQFSQLLESPDANLLGMLEKKCDYLENKLLSYYKKDQNRNEIQLIFSLIKKELSELISSIAKTIKAPYNEARKVVNHVEKSTKAVIQPVINVGEEILEAGEKIVDMATPDFMKDKEEDS